MVGLLERLLSPFTAGSDGLGVELEVGAAGVHVVQLGSALVISGRKKYQWLHYKQTLRLYVFGILGHVKGMRQKNKFFSFSKEFNFVSKLKSISDSYYCWPSGPHVKGTRGKILIT